MLHSINELREHQPKSPSNGSSEQPIYHTLAPLHTVIGDLNKVRNLSYCISLKSHCGDLIQDTVLCGRSWSVAEGGGYTLHLTCTYVLVREHYLELSIYQYRAQRSRNVG